MAVEMYIGGLFIALIVVAIAVLLWYLIREEECKKTQYGCCPDNKTAKADPDGCNCFDSSCNNDVQKCILKDLPDDIKAHKAGSKIAPFQNLVDCVTTANKNCLKKCDPKNPATPSDNCKGCCMKKCNIKENIINDGCKDACDAMTKTPKQSAACTTACVLIANPIPAHPERLLGS
jgi:hypothetical protein